MGAPFWSTEEREYFLNEILPLSQYPNGVYTPGGKDFAELAPIMQVELDRRGHSKRQYTGKKLFQHYYQRVGEVAQKRETKNGNAQSPGASLTTTSNPQSAQTRRRAAQANPRPSAIWPRVYQVEKVEAGKILYADVFTQTEMDYPSGAILKEDKEQTPDAKLLNQESPIERSLLGLVPGSVSHGEQTPFSSHSSSQALASSSAPHQDQTPHPSARPLQALAPRSASRQDQVPYSALPPAEVGLFQRTSSPAAQPAVPRTTKISSFPDDTPVPRKRKAPAKPRVKKQPVVEPTSEHPAFGLFALANPEAAANTINQMPVPPRTPPIDRLLSHFTQFPDMNLNQNSRVTALSPMQYQYIEPEESRYILPAYAPSPYRTQSSAQMGQKRKRAFVELNEDEQRETFSAAADNSIK